MKVAVATRSGVSLWCGSNRPNVLPEPECFATPCQDVRLRHVGRSPLVREQPLPSFPLPVAPQFRVRTASYDTAGRNTAPRWPGAML